VLTAGGIIALHVGTRPAGPIVTSTNGTRPA
jgi:demethylmenaquinone methyltransferase/2-methoxy-6-polyprenyl-1,4-benzoquinol methylase